MANPKSKTEEYLDDAAITTKIKAKFAADDIMKALNIKVITDHCHVTLSGKVANQQAAERAIELVKSTVGVEDIINNIEIKND